MPKNSALWVALIALVVAVVAVLAAANVITLPWTWH